MIGYLSGKVIKIDGKCLLISDGNIGYKVNCTPTFLLSTKLGEQKDLFIHTHVKEDALDLYGFLTDTELEIFEKLISVSGIGPKSALAMLSVHSPNSIANAIENSDLSVLSHTPGIGKKTAEKIIIELKGKLLHLKTSDKSEATDDVRLALEALGYSGREINEVVEKLNPEKKNSGVLIKEALRLLK